MQIGIKRNWNLLITCDYGVGKKQPWQNKKMKKHLSIQLKVDSKLEFIWVGQKLFTLKLHPYTNFNASIITSENLKNMKATMG